MNFRLYSNDGEEMFTIIFIFNSDKGILTNFIRSSKGCLLLQEAFWFENVFIEKLNAEESCDVTVDGFR